MKVRVGRPEEIDDTHLQRYLYAAQFAEGKTVLDAACGIGYGSAILRKAGALRVLGVDTAEEAIDTARRLYGAVGIDYRAMDCLAVTGAYELVVSMETIEHLEDGAAWPARIAQVLTPDGTAILSTPVRELGKTIDSQPFNLCHRREWSVREFRELLEGSFRQVVLLLQGLGLPPFRGNIVNRGIQRLFMGLELRAQALTSPSPVLTADEWFGAYSCRPAYMIAVCREPILHGVPPWGSAQRESVSHGRRPVAGPAADA